MTGHSRFNVLFVCTGNSARSILAEALMNHLPIAAQTFRAYSAGSHPKGDVHPLALDLLRTRRIPVDGLRSKSWSEFEGADTPRMDFVVTVCDQAAAEPCPFWPGHPIAAHWGLPDPAAVAGSDAETRTAFRDAYLLLRHRIELFAGLPLDTLSRSTLQQRLDEIGRASLEATSDRA